VPLWIAGARQGTSVPQGAAVSVGGAVKTPSLRNIELTAPFFLMAAGDADRWWISTAVAGTSPLRIPILSSNGQASAPESEEEKEIVDK